MGCKTEQGASGPAEVRHSCKIRQHQVGRGGRGAGAGGAAGARGGGGEGRPWALWLPVLGRLEDLACGGEGLREEGERGQAADAPDLLPGCPRALQGVGQRLLLPEIPNAWEAAGRRNIL